MGWGAPAGSPFAGPGAGAASAAAGLPFAGIPPELAERVQGVLATEPVHPDPAVRFEAVDPGERFTLRGYLRPHRAALLGALVLVVVETVAMQAGPLLTKIAIDRGIAMGDTSILVAVCAAYLGSILCNALAGAARLAVTARIGEQLMEELRLRVFSHLQRLSMDFYTGERAGRLMTRMTSDIDALSVLFQDGLVSLAVQGLTLVVITAILFQLDPTLATVTVAAIVPAMVVLTWWFRGASDRAYGSVRDRIAEVLSDLQENLSGIRVVTASNRRAQNRVHHRNVIGDHLDANLTTARIGAVYGPGSEALGIVAQAVVLGVGGHMVLRGELTIGELTAFVLYLTAFFAPIQQLVQLYNTYQQGRAAIAKLDDLLQTPPTVAERPGAAVLPPVEGSIELDHVSFGYGQAGEVLHDVTLHVAPGETIALVGPTGAGKSTIAKLIGRFYDPTGGTVRIDGVDIRTVTLASLRSQLGVVPQEAFLFHGTIRDNVAFARPDAPDADVLEACAAVGLEPLLRRLPDGLDSTVHERGASLSAGERQLLALARAFLARPRVLVLDEATSNLDLRSEAAIEQALDALLEGRTAIVIAHRLATARRADRIAVIDGGGIAELGTHDELVAAGARYASLYATWARHAEPS